MKTTNKFLFLFLIGILLFSACTKQSFNENNKEKKVYWFIPDGMRADPDTFNIFEWAQNGELPNIKKMMDEGSYGYSIPTFPSHTPTNFATLLTGTYPNKHGVADGPMHIEGKPLNKVSIGGFSSVAKKIDPIWVTLEEHGLDVLLLSMPGSTPPELDQGTTIRGRWGGWGADFHAINFESKEDLKQRRNQGRGSRLFFFGPELTQYIESSEAKDWKIKPLSYSPALETKMTSWGATIYAYIYDATNDNKINYDSIMFSKDKNTKITTIKKGQWSNWEPITLKWNDIDVDSHVIMNIIKLEDDGFFRIRLFYNNLKKKRVTICLGDLICIELFKKNSKFF